MPVQSPFFSRTFALCHSMRWKEWAGYYAVSSFQIPHDAEYFAIRNAAGLLDVTPLFKYRVSGPDAGVFLSRIMVRDISRIKIGRVVYSCWCTHEGKVVDDGTVMRLGDQDYFVTSADPSFSWFNRFTRRMQVTIKDVTENVAALAIQGPSSGDILSRAVDFDVHGMRYFDVREAEMDGFRAMVSRTGYTGDLGFEIWVENNHALNLWDSLMVHGKDYNLRPVGLDALDVTRVEAGLILKNVDYYNALHVLIDSRKSSPFELSLGWMVDLDRPPFNGSGALKTEKTEGRQWSLVGLDISWTEIEALYASYGLPPEISHNAWRDSIPVYSRKDRKRQIGYATSGTWSPILKKNIALATLKTEYAQMDSEVQIETTVEHRRHVVGAVVCRPQFFNPERKTSVNKEYLNQ